MQMIYIYYSVVYRQKIEIVQSDKNVEFPILSSPHSSLWWFTPRKGDYKESEKRKIDREITKISI